MESILFIVLIVGFFYVAMIRPQQRRERQRRAVIADLNPGDEIVTIGGIIGTITAVDDDSVHLQVADGTVIRLVKRAVSYPVEEEQAAEEPEQEKE